MAPDDLNAPLGQTKRKPPRRFGAPQIVAALLATSAIAVAGWAAFVNDPLGGEPTAVVAIKAGDGKPAAHISEASAAHAPTQQAKAAPPASASPVPSDAKTVTIIDGASGNRQEVVVPEKADKRSSLNPANANLLEPTKFGAIPKVGADGARAGAGATAGVVRRASFPRR